jgi:hypothetical protein
LTCSQMAAPSALGQFDRIAHAAGRGTGGNFAHSGLTIP